MNSVEIATWLEEPPYCALCEKICGRWDEKHRRFIHYECLAEFEFDRPEDA